MQTKPASRRYEPTPAPDSRALARLPQDAPYLSLWSFAVFFAPGHDALAVARMLEHGDLLWRATATVQRFAAPHLLSPREVREDNFLNAVRRAIPKTHRLVVAAFPDGTVAATLLRRGENSPAWWWTGMAYDVARSAPRLADLTEQRSNERAAPQRTSLHHV